MNEKQTDKLFNHEYLINLFDDAFQEKGESFEIENRFSSPEYLTEGGSKKLFLVKDFATKRTVVKAIPLKSDPESIATFIREAELLAALQHPNILPVYDVGTDEEGNPYTIIKYLEGESLDKIIGQENIIKKIEIFEKICTAIAYAHSNNVCHMDLKPQNIIISKFGDITVCDWGSARKIDEPNTAIPITATPTYAAPEVFKGQIGKHCDIYSLGCILYEIITGKIFNNLNGSSTIIKSRNITNKDLILVNDPSLRAICKVCLEPEVNNRIASIEEIIHRMTLYKQKMPIPEENAGALRKLNLLSKRKPAVMLSTAFFMILISAISLYAAYIFKNQKNLVEIQKDLAAQKQFEAEKNLNQYLTEKAQKVKLAHNHGIILFEQAKRLYKFYQHREAMELLELSIALSGVSNDKIELLGILQMLNFDIEAARQSFSRINKLTYYEPYLKFIPYREDLRNMTVDEQVQLLLKINKFQSIFFYHVCGSIFNQEMMTDKSIEELLTKLVKSYHINPKPFSIKYHNRTLIISGDASFFHMQFLAPLRSNKLEFVDCNTMPYNTQIQQLYFCTDLEELNFINTPLGRFADLKELNIKRLTITIGDFAHIRNLSLFPIEELNIAGSTPDSLEPLLSMDSLKKLTISNSMKNLKGYEELSKKIEIIVK